MKYFFRLSAILLLFISCVVSTPAIAASSSSVTPSAFSEFSPEELRNKDFSGKTLQSVDFAKVELEEADFSNADLRGAVFNASNLGKANLRGADFSYGFAYLTNFDGADLTDSIFQETILSFSTFRDTKITGADFSLAVLEKWQVKQLCANAEGVNPKTGVDTRDSLGCP
ncbi:Pentapeptide repeat protein Rfr32 [Hyella patelloides LEGE 07179]|uniref:Pentapeptide repeat protein Rfr32 n=1 Tax=Hyella patelloides LEGE 07179 TaxID=945734 RepID=A0A563VM87_9CYAN|nr:pentapeptide repeat-containing protein [Hyella patelloides]VEP12574.1 Pentapeptide repeat protein Rfr32 [Hyella patelloides LEGE 07179]